MYVNPSTSFESTVKFPTGLTGTLGVRVIDNQGNTTIARTTSGIAEYPDGSGIYAVTLTSPGAPGQYSIVWDDAAGHWADDDLVVTSEISVTVIGTGNLYVTRADLKTILGVTNDRTYIDEAIDIACAAAARSIDSYKRSRYYPTTEIRFYTCRDTRDDRLFIDELNALSGSGVTVDQDGDHTYEESWVEGTDFVLDPANAELEGKPKREIVLLRQAGRRFPHWERGVRVSASFGWASAPSEVTQAAVLLANRFLSRQRSAPLAILQAAAQEAVALARVGRIDPDAAFLLDQLDGGRPDYGSIRLG